MTQTPRQAEIAQLARNMRTGNFNRQTLARFRELVALEAQPAIDAELARRIPAAVQHARWQAEAREAARRAGQAAGRRVFAQWQQRNRRW